MTQKNDNREFTRLVYRAYVREGSHYHTGEAMMLACLVHTRAVGGRKGKHMDDIQAIMKDHNRKATK